MSMTAGNVSHLTQNDPSSHLIILAWSQQSKPSVSATGSSEPTPIAMPPKPHGRHLCDMARFPTTGDLRG